MIENVDSNWFEEDYGFFGDFYYIADNSAEGPFGAKHENRNKRTEREVDMVTNLLGIKENDSLFDCPCGWGRHSIELAKRGVNITSIDINESYLSTLSSSLANEDEEVRRRVSILNVDMRKIQQQTRKFDFGINMFTSFGFFDDSDNKKVIENFCNLLTDKGKLLIHSDFNPLRLLKGIGDDYANIRSILHEGKRFILDVEKIYNKHNKRLYGCWRLTDPEGEVLEKKYSFRIYDNQEMTALLMNAGFQNVSFYSSEMSELTEDSVDSIIVAEK